MNCKLFFLGGKGKGGEGRAKAKGWGWGKVVGGGDDGDDADTAVSSDGG